MTNIIYIILLLMVLISGLVAISPYDINGKSKKEETVIEKIGFINKEEMKKYYYNKTLSIVVFVLSLASLMSMYFIKG